MRGTLGLAVSPVRAQIFIEPLAGRRSEVVRVGLAGAEMTHIIFVPGNPGVPAYYLSTVESLAVSLNATAAVVGLLGHSSTPIRNDFMSFGEPALAASLCRFS